MGRSICTRHVRHSGECTCPAMGEIFPIFNNSMVTGTIAPGGVDFFDFDLPTDVCATCDTHFIKFDTIGSSFDTQLGLFDASGILITFDDDSGAFGGLASVIEIGKDVIGTIANSGGDVPFLAAGGYTLAICGFFCDFADGFIVSTSGTDEFGDYKITVMVPEPTTLAIFGLGLAGLGFFMRRRRRVV